MKRFFIIFLILVFSISTVTLANDDDIIDSGECGEDAIWILFEDGELIIKGSGEMGTFSDNFEEYIEEIRAVTIKEGITRVDNIDNCINLQEISFSDTVHSIEGFSNCGFNEINLPSTIKEVWFAFNECSSLKKVYLPKNLEVISESFIDCEEMEVIEWNATKACFDESLAWDESFSNAGTSGKGISLSFGDKCEYVPEYLFSCHRNMDNDEFIRPKVTQVRFGKNVEEIGEHAFENCESLEKIIFSDKLRKIGKAAFVNCKNVEEICIPNSVEEMDFFAFEGCESMKKIVSPFIVSLDGCEKIEEIEITNEGEVNLYEMGYEDIESLRKFTINAEEIDDSDYDDYGYDNLKYLKIGNMPQELPHQMLNCLLRIEELSIPFVGDTRTSNGNSRALFGYIFDNSGRIHQEYARLEQYYSQNNSETYFIPASLKKIYITDATQIPYGAFDGCNGLEYIELNEGVTHISQNAFANCGFLSVKIPKSVKKIGSGAFEGTDIDTLYVYKNSYAHEYAEENDYPYEFINSSYDDYKTEKDESSNKYEFEDDDIVEVENIEIDCQFLGLWVGDTRYINATVYPSNATDKKIVWTTSNNKVATVTDGKIYAKSVGQATITAKTKDGSCRATCLVDVDSIENHQIILKIDSKKAIVFGETKYNDVAPKIVNSRTMLPARFVTENLGATVTWDESFPDMVMINKDNTSIILYIGSSIAYLNGQKIILDSPAFIENDRTYTPVRFISEALGADVKWDSDNWTVIITAN